MQGALGSHGNNICPEKARIDQMYNEIYVGDGKEDPSIMNRLSKIEDTLIELRKFKWSFIAIVLALIANIISQHVALKF